jgi:excisionase family DNA binding protein
MATKVMNPAREAAPQRGGMGLASLKEAGDFLNLSRSALYGMMERQEVRYVKLGKSRRIPWEALYELIDKNTVG